MNLLDIAKTTSKPKFKIDFKGAKSFLNDNRAAIAKLRQRGFTWGQIVQVLNSNDININYNNLYQWQLRTFRQKTKKSYVK